MDDWPDRLPEYLVPASLNVLCGEARTAGELLRCPAPMRFTCGSTTFVDCALPCRLDDPAQQRIFFGKPVAGFDRRYPVPPASLCALPGALLAGRAHAVVAQPRHLLVESCRSREVLETDGTFRQIERAHGTHADARPVTLVQVRAPRTTRPLPGTALLLSQYWHFNHHHWLLECLPRLRWLGHEPLLEDALVIGPPQPTALQRECMRLLGVGSRAVDFDAGWWRCERLLFPSLGNFSPDELSWLRRKLAGSASWTLGDEPGERLYVSRARAAGRRPHNEAEVTALLQRHGFKTVHPENDSLQRQIERFSRARVIAGAHGSGLTNALFAPADALVIELAPADRVNHCYWLLANALGQRYAFVAGPAVNEARDFQVPAQELARLLAACL